MIFACNLHGSQAPTMYAESSPGSNDRPAEISGNGGLVKSNGDSSKVGTFIEAGPFRKAGTHGICAKGIAEGRSTLKSYIPYYRNMSEKRNENIGVDILNRILFYN